MEDSCTTASYVDGLILVVFFVSVPDSVPTPGRDDHRSGAQNEDDIQNSHCWKSGRGALCSSAVEVQLKDHTPASGLADARTSGPQDTFAELGQLEQMTLRLRPPHF